VIPSTSAKVFFSRIFSRLRLCERPSWCKVQTNILP
jgi:hypothetical protein